MKFNVYNRFQLEVRREHGAWVAYRLAPGKRTRAADIVIPPGIDPDVLAAYLDDLLHELAGPASGSSCSRKGDG